MTFFTNSVIFLCLVSVNALSIEKVSEKNNVTKRQAEFFPDWVPFKNKHGEELGEFVSVPKTKLKKRLAPPVNFILRAVAEPEGDDYYEKGQGGDSDSEDYYEKKEWSDVNRPAEIVETDKILNHTDISDIDGVVNIITTKPALDVDKIQISLFDNNANKTKNGTNDSIAEEIKENKSVEVEKKESSEEKAQDKKVDKKYEEEAEYEESDVEKRKPEETEEEKRENDAKKAKILDSVDELKVRHAEEQRVISEKEEEVFREEHERNNLKHNPNVGKYDNRGGYKKVSEYDEYEDREDPVHDKYRINPFKDASVTTRQPKKTRKQKKNKSKKEGVGKLSVFKNPQLYMVYDEETGEETTKRPTSTSSLKSSRFSSRYATSTSSPDLEENESISLVPQNTEGKEGEPTLYFPKTRKNKRRRKNKKTTPEPDSHVAETIKETAKGLTTAPGFPMTGTGPDTTVTAADTTATATDTTGTGLDTTGAGTVTTAQETAPSAVSDTVPASSDHKGHKDKNENYKKGGGREYKSEHHEQHEEHGKKAYEGVHKDTKTAKGHHDREDHLGKYSDHDDHKQSHHVESGHYGDHHHEEHGKKHAKYEESGKHSKGHSTKGSHDIHKKDEYEKKVEFFEEEGDSAEEEKHGGYADEKSHKMGGHFGKGKHQEGHHQHHKGDSGHFQKGGHAVGHKGHRASGGHDGHNKNGLAHHHEEGKKSGKKWVYHHGHPAKTANLVLIDRRADQYYHGPQYYG
ncbi:unnamed protein product [Chilo suppressalis]|uniref:Uncharacterized protein n=1 Tax=Chilo suppressalis TaxID=168631 RepID=A0ABN8L4V3_CHISP|nr:unnamed protein product [Chilo suppressalis]